MEQTIPDRFNFLKDIIKLFGVVPADYATLINLETGFHYNHIKVTNTTDVDIIVKFANTAITADWTILAGSSETNDQFSHNGIIQYKYVSGAPATGLIKLTSWLGFQ